MTPRVYIHFNKPLSLMSTRDRCVILQGDSHQTTLPVDDDTVSHSPMPHVIAEQWDRISVSVSSPKDSQPRASTDRYAKGDDTWCSRHTPSGPVASSHCLRAPTMLK